MKKFNWKKFCVISGKKFYVIKILWKKKPEIIDTHPVHKDLNIKKKLFVAFLKGNHCVSFIFSSKCLSIFMYHITLYISHVSPPGKFYIQFSNNTML